MNPGNKGWLKKYFEFRRDISQLKSYKDKISDSTDRLTREKQLYSLIQPTGLMYGHPIQLPVSKHPNMSEWTEKDTMKIILAESLLNSGLVYNKRTFESESEIEEIFEGIGKSISTYYKKILPGIIRMPRLLVPKKKRALDIAEYMLNKRVSVKSKWNTNFWTSFFHNSLLFLDLLYFFFWLESGKSIVKDSLRKEKNEIRCLILKVIAAAAYSNKTIEDEERNIFEYFLESANLPKELNEMAQSLIAKPISLEEIDFEGVESWILKKYLLELAVLTIWSDRVVEDIEKDFIIKFNKKLGFDEEELENSMIAVESFVIENWHHVHYLQDKQNYLILSERLLKRIGVLVKKYKDRLKIQINDTKDLYDLLQKSSETDLTFEEKEKIVLHLIDVLKTLPVFAIIAIPGSFMTLPILFSILPKSAFPSAFDDNKLVGKKKV